MYLPYLFLLLIYHYLPCHGYYGSIFDVVQIREREGAVSWVDNGTIYQVGGQEVPGPTVLVNTIRFDEAENIQYGAATRNMTDVCTLCAAMYVPGNRNVFISRPMENTTDFLYYNLDTNTLNLRVKPANITELPPLQDPSTAPATSNDFLYYFGGWNEVANTYIYRLDPVSLNVTNLSLQPPNPEYASYAGCATTLPSGIIVLAFGDLDDNLIDTASVTLYDPATNTLTSQPISGEAPRRRSYLSCNLGPDESTIFYFGGRDHLITEATGEMYNDLSILDTITWRWVKKDIPGLQPTARINANVEVYDDKLVIINGIAAVIWFTDVSVLKGLPMKGESIDSSNLRWFTNNPAYDNGSYGASKLSEGAIAGIILAVVVVLVIILIVLYKRMRRFRRFLLYIQNEIIWNPRSGEPFWAESSRLIVRFILLFLFSAFFVYTVIRTVNSAIVIQEIRSKTTTVDVPDIRLCLSGYIQEDISQIDCRLMNGTSCNGDVTYLTFNDDNRPQYPTREQFPVSCALYRPPPGFKFINDDKDYSYYTATQITFSIRAPLVNQSIPGIVQMDIYAPNKDPNEVVHGMKTLDQTDLTEADIRQFNISDTTTETYYTTSYLQRGDYATAHYILTQEETLIREDGWNNIGFSNHYDTTTNLAYELSQTPDPLSDPDDYFVGQVRVMPKDFIKRTNREQKVFSLLNGIAQAGGVLGLFIALQTILFGFRPQSPWGIVHRWSFGNLRVKLTERLTTYFNRTEADVPLVNPVSKRFSMVGRPDKYRNEQIDLSHMEDEESMNDKTRIKRMEERLQLMELLLKSYYLNDEVFRSLDVAIKSKKKGGQINRAMNVNNSPLMKSAAEQDSVNNAYLDSEDDTASSNYLTKEKPDLNRNPSSTVFNTNPPHRGNYQPNLSPHIAFDPKE